MEREEGEVWGGKERDEEEMGVNNKEIDIEHGN